MSRSIQLVHVSLVSHGHDLLVFNALLTLAKSLPANYQVTVWLTFNLQEPSLETAVDTQVWPFNLRKIHNIIPLGFGVNHNQAFIRAQQEGGATWFVVFNPDILVPADAEAFWNSLEHQAWPADVGLLCPSQVDEQGQPQDFARRLMTPWGLAARVFSRIVGSPPSGAAKSVAAADWVNGACMVWRSEAFAALRGFDERYFMYCEDTDICLRLQLAGWRMQGADLTVVHDARRNTGRNWRHLSWHIRSMLRLWGSRAYWAYLLRFKLL